MADQQENAMDASSLYREEIYTDRKIGTIRAMVPVLPSGAADVGRAVIYMGEAQIMTQMGALPINFEIEGAGLAEAVAAYGDAANAAVERTMRELQELRRQQASSIVVPGQGGFGVPGAGGKIQMP